MFFSKRYDEDSEFLGADFIEITKTSTKGFFKSMIEILTKDWYRILYLVLKIHPNIHGEITNIDIG